LALIAAAGLFAGGVAMPSAKAADLGGDCCADLEERVAELEATTARKGNRKMGLTITGQVHRVILWWDDGKDRDTYYGLDNTNSSSRFSLLGEAKVTPNVKMGFEIMIEVEAGGTSSKVSQFDEDGKISATTGFAGAGGVSLNPGNADAYFGDARRVAWWIEDKNLGRMTVGRYESAGAITTIDLAGIGQAASASMALVNGGFLLRNSAGGYYGVTLATLTDPAANQGRTELLRYDSPSLFGFIGSASIGEAGDYWGVMLRYAGEFSGFRLAAGIGYEDSTDRQTSALGSTTIATSTGTLALPGAGPNDLLGPDPEVKAWGAGLSVLHVPSGLFAQGHYMAAEFSCITGNPAATTVTGVSGTTASNLATGYWGQTTDCRSDATQWLVQAGITKNWFGLGNTALYGEWGSNDGWGAGIGPGRNASAAVIPGATTVNGIVDTSMTVWGVGIVQQVDAAASTLYLVYRHFSPDITCTGAGSICSGSAGGAAKGLDVEDQQFIMGGAVVKF
jgi:hypothetical protein